MHKIHYFIKLIALLDETFMNSSSLLFVSVDPPTSRSPKHQFIHIAHFSHSIILIQVFKDLTYLPRGPLRKHRSTLL